MSSGAREKLQQIEDIIYKSSSNNLEILAELKKLVPPDDQKTIDESNIIKSFSADIKNFDDARKAYDDSLRYAFKLPLEHFYSKTVKLRGTDAAIYARIEIHKAITDATFNYKIVDVDAKLEECKE